MWKSVVVGHSLGPSGVEIFECEAEEHREKAQSDVLNPEYQRIGGTQIARLHDLRNRGPECGRNQRERDAEQDDRAVGDGLARELREHEGEGQVADDHQNGA